MKILHLIASHRWTGAAEPTARLAAKQTESGHDVLLSLTGGRSLDQKAQELGVATTGKVAWYRKYIPWKKWRDITNLQKLVREFKPDIIHCHLTHDHLMAAVALGSEKKRGIPLVRTFHKEIKPRQDFFTRRFIMARTSGGIGISEQLTKQLRESFKDTDTEFETIGGGLDTELFQPRDRGNVLREKWLITSDAPVIGIVSRIRIERGHEWLLAAAEKALPEFPDAKLVICGRGNWQEEMEEKLKTHPARNQIHYAGYVTGQNLMDSYEAFDAALMLKPGNDGACRSALESMATGKPVIGGNLGAIRDLIDQDPTVGWLAEPDDVDSLASKMKEALRDLSATNQYGENARQLVVGKYSEEALANQTLAFYEKLV